MAFYKLPTGQIVQDGQAFTYDNKSFPANWLRLTSDVEKAAIRIYPYTPPKTEYSKFKRDGEYIALDEARASIMNSTDMVVRSLLEATDWAYVRKIETGQAVPQKIIDYRAAVRAELEKFKRASFGAKSTEELEKAYNAIKWPQMGV